MGCGAAVGDMGGVWGAMRGYMGLERKWGTWGVGIGSLRGWDRLWGG